MLGRHKTLRSLCVRACRRSGKGGGIVNYTNVLLCLLSCSIVDYFVCNRRQSLCIEFDMLWFFLFCDCKEIVYLSTISLDTS